MHGIEFIPRGRKYVLISLKDVTLTSDKAE